MRLCLVIMVKFRHHFCNKINMYLVLFDVFLIFRYVPSFLPPSSQPKEPERKVRTIYCILSPLFKDINLALL
jgi:hypothetical protein